MLSQIRRVVHLGLGLSLASGNVSPDFTGLNALVGAPKIRTLAKFLLAGFQVMLHPVLAIACVLTSGVWTMLEL